MIKRQTKIKTSVKCKRTYGGAIFAAAVFMALSMMVILQDERMIKRDAAVQTPLECPDRTIVSNNSDNQQLQKQIADQRMDIQDLKSQAEFFVKERKALVKLLSVSQLDDRLLGWLRMQSQDIEMGGYIPDSARVLIRRPSPSGERTLVIIGVTSGGKMEAHGYFIREGNDLIDVPTQYFWTSSEIRNVQWKSEGTITYQVFSLDSGKVELTGEESHLVYPPPTR